MTHCLTQWLRCFTFGVALVILGSVGLLADEKPDQKQSPGEKPAAAGEDTQPAADRYTVPDGDVAELVGFIQGLYSIQPASLQEFLDLQKKRPAALRAAADKILKLEKDGSSREHQLARFVLLRLRVEQLSTAKSELQTEILNEVYAVVEKELDKDFATPIAILTSQHLESLQDEKKAAQAYKRIGSALAKHANPQIAERGELFVGAARRINSVGTKFELTGTKFDGGEFSVGDLKGKVVLVDFWATWCGPCIAQMPNIKAAYDIYGKHGFEVVGVSIDENRSALEEFVGLREIPWLILHEKENDGVNQATTHYGIFRFPTMFLLDRSGKVISTAAEGRELQRLLAEQFPDVKEGDLKPEAGK